MKSLYKWLIIGFVFINLNLFSNSVYPQEALSTKIFKIRIYGEKNVLTEIGYLLSVNDTSVSLISRHEFILFKKKKDYRPIIVPFYKINRIFINSRGLPKIIAGGAIGATVGAISFAKSGYDSGGYGNSSSSFFTWYHSAEEVAFLYGILGGFVGLGSGVITGTILYFSSFRNYKIMYNKEKFNRHLGNLRKRSIS